MIAFSAPAATLTKQAQSTNTDNVKARQMQGDGTYLRLRPAADAEAANSQVRLIGKRP